MLFSARVSCSCVTSSLCLLFAGCQWRRLWRIICWPGIVGRFHGTSASVDEVLHCSAPCCAFIVWQLHSASSSDVHPPPPSVCACVCCLWSRLLSARWPSVTRATTAALRSVLMALVWLFQTGARTRSRCTACLTVSSQRSLVAGEANPVDSKARKRCASHHRTAATSLSLTVATSVYRFASQYFYCALVFCC